MKYEEIMSNTETNKKEWIEKFEEEFVWVQQDLNGDIAYKEFKNLSCVEEIESFISEQIKLAREEAIWKTKKK